MFSRFLKENVRFVFWYCNKKKIDSIAIEVYKIKPSHLNERKTSDNDICIFTSSNKEKTSTDSMAVSVIVSVILPWCTILTPNWYVFDLPLSKGPNTIHYIFGLTYPGIHPINMCIWCEHPSNKLLGGF